jgi:hypothetical protein
MRPRDEPLAVADFWLCKFSAAIINPQFGLCISERPFFSKLQKICSPEGRILKKY